jgi:hypothetical protein
MTKKDVKDSLGAQGMSAKRSEAPKVPKITQTSPPSLTLANYIKKRNYVLIVADLLLFILSAGAIWLVLKTFLRPAKAQVVPVR